MKTFSQHLRESISFDIDLEKDSKQYMKENPAANYDVREFFRNVDDREYDPVVLRISKKYFLDYLKHIQDDITIQFKDCYMHIHKNPFAETRGGYIYHIILSKSAKAPSANEWKTNKYGNELYIEGGMYHGSGIQLVKYFLRLMGRILPVVADKSNI